MLHIQQYVKAQSLDEAYELVQKNRNNLVLGGMMWLRMEERHVPVAIDVSNLHLDTIEEREDAFVIGAMTTLRTLETHPALTAYTQGMLRDCVKDIVGVQFRNTATIGGSVYSRFGFSDIICALLSLDCEVVLHKGGVVALHEYIEMPYERDILTHIIIKKTKLRCAYTCVRKSATDLPVLNVSAAKVDNIYRICVGSRPKRAMRIEVDVTKSLEEIAKEMVDMFPCEDNMRASKAYRKRLIEACVYRVLKNIEEEPSCR